VAPTQPAKPGPKPERDRLKATGYRLQATGYRLQATGYRLQANDMKPKLLDNFYFRIKYLTVNRAVDKMYNTDPQHHANQILNCQTSPPGRRKKDACRALRSGPVISGRPRSVNSTWGPLSIQDTSGLFSREFESRR
jgi:hypothetical protein